jgi:hypothetical protein
MDQRGQDDWRKDVALKQLGLTEKGMNWNREDTAAERAAKYGYMGEELGLRREESAANRGLQERGFGLQERGLNIQLSEAERLAKERADRSQFWQNFDPSLVGITDEKTRLAVQAMGVRNPELGDRVLADTMARNLDRANRPEDRAARGEDVRGTLALQNLSQLEQKGQVTPREAQMYAQASAEAQKQGYGGTGGMAPQQVKAQEFAKQQARTIIQRADELAGGMLGYASSKDVQEILDSTSDLAATMEQAGYPPQEINAVMQEIQSRLELINSNDFKTAVR